MLFIACVWIPFTALVQTFRAIFNPTLDVFNNLPEWVEEINEYLSELIDNNTKKQ
jgi:hypothetical protein